MNKEEAKRLIKDEKRSIKDDYIVEKFIEKLYESNCEIIDNRPKLEEEKRFANYIRKIAIHELIKVLEDNYRKRNLKDIIGIY